MGVYITKADGSRQLFDREKVVRTCLRMGANRSIAYKIVGEIERQLYDGITTNKIFNLTFRLLRNYRPSIRHFLDLRKSLSLMVSKPEFEKYIQTLLSYNGYTVSSNRLLMGKCVKHEVDGIAQKNGITYFVEAKHHQNYHSPTGLDESRIARAVLEDITEGYELGKNKLRIDRAMIVTNTRFSEHAKIYGKCRNILQIGWSSPATMALQSMIEEKKAYPLSCLKGLSNSTRIRLVNSGVVLIKQLMDFNTSKLSKISGVSKSTLRKAIEKAKNYPF
ncbi:MAG: restriction endonuclease [Candidatus Bathyarchaeota archaeon]|nr:restriction endonuclease [Candidatus Bathyarchaeota archaeon]